MAVDRYILWGLDGLDFELDFASLRNLRSALFLVGLTGEVCFSRQGWRSVGCGNFERLIACRLLTYLIF